MQHELIKVRTCKGISKITYYFANTTLERKTYLFTALIISLFATQTHVNLTKNRYRCHF